jgi:hypothetical protein
VRVGIVVVAGSADLNMIAVPRTAYGCSVDISRDSSWRLKR